MNKIKAKVYVLAQDAVMFQTPGCVLSRYNLHIPSLLINRNHVIIFKEVSGQFGPNFARN